MWLFWEIHERICLQERQTDDICHLVGFLSIILSIMHIYAFFSRHRAKEECLLNGQSQAFFHFYAKSMSLSDLARKALPLL